MSFTRRYLQWLLVPPLAISLPPALLFLSQVVQLSVAREIWLAVMLMVNYAIGCVLFTRAVKPRADAVQSALAGDGDLSTAMSECLDRTTSTSMTLWFGGGILFAIVAAAIFLPSPLGFSYFFVASLIAAF